MALTGCWKQHNPMDEKSDDTAVEDSGIAPDEVWDTDTYRETQTDTESAADYDTATDAPGAGIAWIPIAGGSFLMGSKDGATDERPVHAVTVPSFEMMQAEATVDSFERCAASGVCGVEHYYSDASESRCNFGEAPNGSHPMNCVDWHGASEYCSFVGGRLPSEAEWEYAARSGGQDQQFPWGDEMPTCDFAVMNDASAGGSGCGQDSTSPICSKPAGNTEQGLCDMAGNVAEWVEDYYHSDYEGAPTDGSAWVTDDSNSPTDDPRYVVRGGWWHYDGEFLSTTLRLEHYPSMVSSYFGVRCARSTR